MAPIKTAEQQYAEWLRDRINAVAKGLHDLADEVARHAAAVDKVDGIDFNTYSHVARNVAHSLTWGVANLHVEAMISDAAGADIARAKGE